MSTGSRNGALTETSRVLDVPSENEVNILSPSCKKVDLAKYSLDWQCDSVTQCHQSHGGIGNYKFNILLRHSFVTVCGARQQILMTKMTLPPLCGAPLTQL